MRTMNRAAAAAGLALTLSCGAEPGPQGPKGIDGTNGMNGLNGMNGKDGVDATLAFTDCPIGYAKDNAAAGITVCKKGADELVKVGTGSSGFWIDRYEASVWNQAGTTQYGATADDYPATFPKNGQATGPVAFALSKKDVTPSRNITWFQAQAACHESGKQLPDRREWLMAAQATPDPGVNTGSQGFCVTSSTDPRATGQATNCKSRWGAEDMIGNLWEWTDEWYAGLGQADFSVQPWPKIEAGNTADYGNDGTWNIASKANPGNGAPVTGLPAAGLRGGSWLDTTSGVFALALNHAPSSWASYFGFRCVVRR